MAKKNYSTVAEDINRVDLQGKKVLFLQETITELNENSLFVPSLETEFIDHDLYLVYTEMKLTAKKPLLSLLTKKLKAEEAIYKNLLSKQQ